MLIWLDFVFFYFSVKKLVNCKDWNLMNWTWVWTSLEKIVEVELSREEAMIIYLYGT